MATAERFVFSPEETDGATQALPLILRQSHRIENLVSLESRSNKARPYPNDGFDFLAINVPSSFQQGIIPDGEEPPWGMLRVVAVARELHGINAGILDAHRLRLQPQDIREQIIKTKAKLIGLNPTSVNIVEARCVGDICDELKVPYILGGVHATLDPKLAHHDFPSAAALVRGHGEFAIKEAVDVLLNGGQKNEGGGIYYRGDNNSKRRDYAMKIHPNEIPLVRQDVYIEEPVYVHDISINGSIRKISEATLFITDGCPFECTFCSSPIMVNRKGDIPYLRPQMEKIVDEVDHVVNDLGATAIHFLDDMAFIKGDNIRDFHRGLQERGLLGKFIWRGLTRAPVVLRKDFNEEVMEMMRESGIWKVALGIESGSNEVLQRIRKKVTREQVIDAVTKLSAYGIQVKGFFIMGFPDETEMQIRETYNLIFELKERGLTEIAVFQFKPYPGTVEYETLLAQKPHVRRSLHYLWRDGTGLSGIAKYRAEQKDVWLPDDLMIAEISSGKVRAYVMRALERFYSDSPFGMDFSRYP